MKITTIKQYENDYFVTFGYNGAQFGETETKIEKNVERSAKSQAHDCFVEDTNRYRSIPTPQFEDCSFEIKSAAYTSEKNFRIYTVKVHVTWQFAKS